MQKNCPESILAEKVYASCIQEGREISIVAVTKKTSRRLIGLLWLCLLWLCLVFSPGVACSQAIQIGSVDFASCRINGIKDSVLCGRLTVFEDNIARKGRRIPLNIVVLPAAKPGNRKEATFILMGGPGQAATDEAPFFATAFQPIQAGQDIVLIDQRGTGNSHPLKLQPGPQALQDFFTDGFLDDERIRRNYEAFQRTHCLACYTTRNFVIDLEDIRQAMGYEKINLYGASYGTRVALAYMTEHPATVRTATFKGVVPADLVIPESFAHDSQRSLELLLAHCEKDSLYKARYPNFRKELAAVLQRLEKTPATVELTNPATGKMEQARLGKDIVAFYLRLMLMVPALQRQLPALVRQAHEGNYNPLAQLIVALRQSNARLYDALFLCVVCMEDYPYWKEAPATDPTFLGDYWLNRIENACAVWNPGKRKAWRYPNTHISIPTLLISGQYDPATPPVYGEQVKRLLPNSRHVVVENASHSFDNMRGCVETIVCDFIRKGNLQSVDVSCVENIAFPFPD